MTDYTPDTTEVRTKYRLSSGIGLEVAHNEFDRWHTEEIRKAKEEAWEEGRSSADTEYEHIFNGHPVQEGEICGECEQLNRNPYRKEQND